MWWYTFIIPALAKVCPSSLFLQLMSSTSALCCFLGLTKKRCALSTTIDLSEMCCSWKMLNQEHCSGLDGEEWGSRAQPLLPFAPWPLPSPADEAVIATATESLVVLTTGYSEHQTTFHFSIPKGSEQAFHAHDLSHSRLIWKLSSRC